MASCDVASHICHSIFDGFDGIQEPHRVPYRARAPVGRRDTDVTRPDLVPPAKQKATLMNTAKKLSTAALEADRKLTAMEIDKPRSRITRSETPIDRDALGRACHIMLAKLYAATQGSKRL